VKPQTRPQHVDSRYTQINILFPSSDAELPSADKFRAFPPEAQIAILEGFKKEQQERHAWLKTQQSNEHELNIQGQRHYFYWRLTGTIFGGLLAILTIGMGAWLVAHGASATGVGMMLVAAATIIGSAVYGHKTKQNAEPEEKD
jgi:uncharacterized membrane protein